jgi:hypothetical protein
MSAPIGVGAKISAGGDVSLSNRSCGCVGVESRWSRVIPFLGPEALPKMAEGFRTTLAWESSMMSLTEPMLTYPTGQDVHEADWRSIVFDSAGFLTRATSDIRESFNAWRALLRQRPRISRMGPSLLSGRRPCLCLLWLSLSIRDPAERGRVPAYWCLLHARDYGRRGHRASEY